MLERTRREPCLSNLPNGLAALSFSRVSKLQKQDATRSPPSTFCSDSCERTCIFFRSFVPTAILPRSGRRPLANLPPNPCQRRSIYPSQNLLRVFSSIPHTNGIR